MSGKLNPDFVGALMGFPDGWLDGVSRRSALRMFGNAVMPQVAEVVGLVGKVATPHLVPADGVP